MQLGTGNEQCGSAIRPPRRPESAAGSLAACVAGTIPASPSSVPNLHNVPVASAGTAACSWLRVGTPLMVSCLTVLRNRMYSLFHGARRDSAEALAGNFPNACADAQGG